MGAVLSAVVTAAGFASPEVRKATCLELPTAAELDYPAAAANEVPFSRLASAVSQLTYDNRDVVFRARYYGEAGRDPYVAYLNPQRLEGRAVLNLRAVDHVSSATPFGPDTESPPPFAVLANADTLASLEGAEPGSLVEVRGLTHHLMQLDPDSTVGKSYVQLAATMRQNGKESSMPIAPEYVALVVDAASVRRLEPVNDPRGRWTCRLIHGLDPLAILARPTARIPSKTSG